MRTQRRGIRCPAGFTLMELLVGLLLVGVVGLLGAVLISAGVQAEQTVQLASIAHHRVTHPRLIWRDLLLHARSQALPGEPARPFAGSTKDVQFVTQCPNGEGFRRRCTVRGESIDSPGLVGLRFTFGTGTWLLETDAPVELRYLAGSVTNEAWLVRWEESDRVPIGVALVGQADTLVFRLGAPQ